MFYWPRDEGNPTLHKEKMLIEVWKSMCCIIPATVFQIKIHVSGIFFMPQPISANCKSHLLLNSNTLNYILIRCQLQSA